MLKLNPKELKRIGLKLKECKGVAEERKPNKLEIGISCRTRKEHYVMLALIVTIQYFYRKRFAEKKKVSFRKLLEMALKQMEKRDSAFYPFSNEDEDEKI